MTFAPTLTIPRDDVAAPLCNIPGDAVVKPVLRKVCGSKSDLHVLR